jgi:predicted nuclease of predicted toxin-antitoxin system
VKFLVDAQLPPALARWITERGHAATHVFEHGLASADDSILWEHARQQSCIIVSKDEDFVDRWLTSSKPVPVVWLRKGNCSNRVLIAWIAPLWPLALARLEQGEQMVELCA